VTTAALPRPDFNIHRDIPPVEADQMKTILTDVDSDDGKVFEASCLLCRHGCFSLLRG
jgi:hypothetical protein